MPKVFFINRFFYPDHSATSQLLSDLCFDLAEERFDADVVTSRQLYEDPDAELPAEEEVNGVKVHRVWTATFERGIIKGPPALQPYPPRVNLSSQDHYYRTRRTRGLQCSINLRVVACLSST